MRKSSFFVLVSLIMLLAITFISCGVSGLGLTRDQVKQQEEINESNLVLENEKWLVYENDFLGHKGEMAYYFIGKDLISKKFKLKVDPGIHDNLNRFDELTELFAEKYGKPVTDSPPDYLDGRIFASRSWREDSQVIILSYREIEGGTAKDLSINIMFVSRDNDNNADILDIETPFSF